MPENISEKRVIYKYEHVFLEGPVQPGYYQFPYSYTVPQNLPTSFVERKNDNNYAKIEYYTKCVFESQDG